MQLTLFHLPSPATVLFTGALFMLSWGSLKVAIILKWLTICILQGTGAETFSLIWQSLLPAMLPWESACLASYHRDALFLDVRLFGLSFGEEWPGIHNSYTVLENPAHQLILHSCSLSIATSSTDHIRFALYEPSFFYYRFCLAGKPVKQFFVQQQFNFN